jgi:hydrogenase nickel incorporation protein HypA/HybF
MFQYEQTVHELSIATAILDKVAAAAQRHPGARFTKVGVRIGEISGVDPDSLSFGFECLVKDSQFDPLVLEIELCPRMQRCLDCACEFHAPDSMTACPKCGHPHTTCIGGEELDIAFMEIEEAEEAAGS